MGIITTMTLAIIVVMMTRKRRQKIPHHLQKTQVRLYRPSGENGDELTSCCQSMDLLKTTSEKQTFGGRIE